MYQVQDLRCISDAWSYRDAKVAHADLEFSNPGKESKQPAVSSVH
jgi:hypothetical protein